MTCDVLVDVFGKAHWYGVRAHNNVRIPSLRESPGPKGFMVVSQLGLNVWLLSFVRVYLPAGADHYPVRAWATHPFDLEWSEGHRQDGLLRLAVGKDGREALILDGLTFEANYLLERVRWGEGDWHEDASVCSILGVGPDAPIVPLGSRPKQAKKGGMSRSGKTIESVSAPGDASGRGELAPGHHLVEVVRES